MTVNPSDVSDAINAIATPASESPVPPFNEPANCEPANCEPANCELANFELANCELANFEPANCEPADYEADYFHWLHATATQLRLALPSSEGLRRYAAIDWDNLIEELKDMGKREQRRRENNSIVLLLHLLKWQFQAERRSGSWQGSIVAEWCDRSKTRLVFSPS